MKYAAPNTPGSVCTTKERYDNFIGGRWVAPAAGRYFDNASPITGENYCQVARSDSSDIEAAIDAATAAAPAWGSISVAERSQILNKIADRIEANLERLAVLETWDNGKPVRESLNADLPLVVDHWRYFASVIRAEEGISTEIDADTVAYHFQEPMGVVGLIIPWNFPLLLASWKLAPALAAGNTIVLKPAEQTPVSILEFAELIADLLPDGVLNIVNGFGEEAGAPLAQSPRISKVSFTGETSTGRLIMEYASKTLNPVTLELGGKSPNIFFPDIMSTEDGLLDKALEGFTLFALNQGEACTCPSRALVHESIYDDFLALAIPRVQSIVQGDPLDDGTMLGAQGSAEQMRKVLSYCDIAQDEGAKILVGGEAGKVEGREGGYYVRPTVIAGTNDMRVFQEEIFGPVVAVTKFSTMQQAIEIANDTQYGLGAAVWTRDMNTAYRVGRGIKAGRVWTNCYHLYPAGAAFGGYKNSGLGRENHKMMLQHYQQTKNLLVSYSTEKLGLF